MHHNLGNLGFLEMPITKGLSMEDVNLVFEGFKFMILGMGTVFLFLLVMILFMNIMTRVVNRYFPDVHPSEIATKQSMPDDKKKIVAAISAAIMHHRNRA